MQTLCSLSYHDLMDYDTALEMFCFDRPRNLTNDLTFKGSLNCLDTHINRLFIAVSTSTLHNGFALLKGYLMA